MRSRAAELSCWLRILLPRSAAGMLLGCDGLLPPGPLLALKLLLASVRALRVREHQRLTPRSTQEEEAGEAFRSLRRGTPPPPAFLGGSFALEARVRVAAKALAAAALRRLDAVPHRQRSPFSPPSAHRLALAAACRASEKRCAAALFRAAEEGEHLCDRARLAAAWRRAARRCERSRMIKGRRGPPDLASVAVLHRLALAGLLTTRVKHRDSRSGGAVLRSHAACTQPDCASCRRAPPFRLPASS